MWSNRPSGQELCSSLAHTFSTCDRLLAICKSAFQSPMLHFGRNYLRNSRALRGIVTGKGVGDPSIGNQLETMRIVQHKYKTSTGLVQNFLTTPYLHLINSLASTRMYLGLSM